MIQIPGVQIETIDLSSLSNLEKEILYKKGNSPTLYRYDSLHALIFELNMRGKIVEAARAMSRSHANFTTFRHSRANEQFWLRTASGGLQKRSGVSTSEAIEDIFENGHLYGFECATAMVVILYKATMDVLGNDRFNEYFPNVLLYGWYRESNLKMIIINDKNEMYPGDVVYFKNPDFNPDAPQWQGENAVYLTEHLYFGHGIGIRTEEEMIAALNQSRKPGSTTSAFLSDLIVHPDFDFMRNLAGPSLRATG